METKWTPGPWEAVERGAYSDFGGHSRVVVGDDMRIAVVHHSNDIRDDANANLIASAPDMYEALEKIRAGDSFNCSPHQRFMAAQGLAERVLAKARGEST